MSLITRINQLFVKAEPSSNMGISIQQQNLGFCCIDENNAVSCDGYAVYDNQYKRAFDQLHSDQSQPSTCYLVLSSKQNQLVQIDRPNVPDNEINAAVKWQVKDLVSLAPENMIVDYFDGPKSSGGTEKINIVCANKEYLQQLVQQTSKDNMLVKAITIEEFAFASLCPVQDEARLLLCQQPNEEMLILIVKQGALYFQRRLRGMDTIGSKSEEELDAGVVDSLTLELQRSIDYFERQLKQAPIRSVDILVPIETEAFLARRLAENSSVPVHLFEMPEQFKENRAFAACVGATMLNHMEKLQ